MNPASLTYGSGRLAARKARTRYGQALPLVPGSDLRLDGNSHSLAPTNPVAYPRRDASRKLSRRSAHRALEFLGTKDAGAA